MPIAFRACRASNNGSGGTTLTMDVPAASTVGVRSVGQGSNNGAGAASISVVFPSGTTAGDILVFALTVVGGTGITITTPTGWTLFDRTNSTTALGQAVYWKLCTPVETSAGSVSVTITSCKASAVCMAISTGNSTSPVAAMHSAQANASSLTVSFATLGSFTSQNGIDLAFGGMVGANTTAAPTNYTNDTSGASTGGAASSRCTTGCAHRILSATTTVGTLTEAWTGTAGINIGHHIWIGEMNPTPVAVSNNDVMVAAITVAGGTGTSITPPASAWSQDTSPFTSTHSIDGLAYGNGVWVCSTTGVFPGQIATSSDGISWTISTPTPWTVANEQINRVRFWNGQFIGLGASGTMATSSDGVTWSSGTQPFGANKPCKDICYDGSSTYLLVGGDNTGGLISTSTDLSSWASVTNPLPTTNVAVASCNYGAGVFVIVGQYGNATNNVASSSTGSTGSWTVQTCSGINPANLPFTNSVFILCGTQNNGGTATNDIVTSTDGATWTNRTIGFTTNGTEACEDAVWNGTEYTAVGSTGKMYTSPDVATWTAVGSPGFGTNRIDAIEADPTGRLVATSATSPNKIGTKPPPPWTLLSRTDSTTTLGMAVYWRVASSEPANYAFTLGASVKASGVMYALNGARTDLPASTQYAGQANASSTSDVTAALGTWDPVSYGVALGLFGYNAAVDVSPPGSYTDPQYCESASITGNTTHGDYQAGLYVTTLAAITATASSAAVNIGYLVFIFEPGHRKPSKPGKPGQLDAGFGSINSVLQAVPRGSFY